MIAWLACGLCASILGADVGPRITDAEFFAAMDLTEPKLAAVQAAVQRQDFPAAKAAFAEHFKKRTTPVWLGHPAPGKKPARYDSANADKILAHQFRFSMGAWFDLGKRIDWASNQMAQGESATIEWNAQLNRHFHFNTLADAYQKTGDDKYAAEIVAQMLAWIADCPVLQGRSGNGPYHHAWETLNTAIRAGDTWPNALYRILSSPSLTPEAVATIVKSMVEHARHLDRWPTKSGNWLTAESKGIFVIGTLLPEFREAKTWRQHAVERLAGQLKTDVYPDGLEIELALGYSSWVLDEFAFAFELARANGRGDELPQDYMNQLERMYDYLAYAVMPTGQVPGLNDAGNMSPARLLEKGLEYFPKRQDFQFVATRGKQGTTPQKTSVAFPYTGHYVMRSGWDAAARYLLFDAGPFGSGHQHEDKLHVIVAAYNRVLLVDAGSYMYDRSRWRRYVLSTRGHNTVRVDGCDQNSRRQRSTWVLPQPFKPLDNTWASTEQFDYAVGRYDSGYGDKGAISVVHTRAVVFVKPDYWVLVDTLDPQDRGEHRYESLFHISAEAAQVDEQTHAVTATNPQAAGLVLRTLPAPGLRLEVVKGLEEEPVQGWANSPWRPVPTAIVRANGVGRIRLVTILEPTAPGKKSRIESVEPREVLADGKRAADAVALRVRFLDGTVHQLLMADRSGVRRKCDWAETEAALDCLQETSGKRITFHHP